MKLFRISTVPISLNLLLKGQLKYLNHFYEVTAISGAGKDLQEVREREGVKTFPITIERQISPVKDLISLIKLYRYFKKEKPAIIHSITPKAGLLSMIAGKLAGVPVRMHTFTGLIFPHKEGHFQSLLVFMDRLLCKFATHVYPEGNGVKEDLLAHHITKKPLKIIGNGNVNGIDLEHFSPNQVSMNDRNELREKIGFSESDFVFVFVGRLVKDKGINELVSAFSTLQLTHTPTPKLLFVGPTEQHLDPILPETLAEIEKNPDIVATGFQQDVRKYLAISNALVFPSYREGLPNVVLQSLAMQLPVIASDINGCKEIINDNENGIKVEVKNVTELKEAMLKLLTDKNFYEKLKAKTRESVQPYCRDLVWKSLLEEYRELERANGNKKF